jgi:glycosyltransferase involved in cell wall biosynthesis
MAAAMRRVKPDLVHVRGLLNPGFHGVWAARLSGCPRVLVSVHGIGIDMPLEGVVPNVRRWLVHYLLETLTLRWADAVYCVCESTARRPFVRRNASRLLGVVYNGIEVQSPCARDERLRQTLGYTQADVVAVYVGRLALAKGVFDLAAAIQRLDAQSVPQPRVLFVGEGPEAERLRDILIPQVASGRVRFFGPTTAVAPLLAISDFLILPSWSENLSNALIEAMHECLAVLVTSVGGSTEVVVPNQTGWLVPPHDSVALADAMRRMASAAAERKRMGLAGRRRVETHFAMAQTTARLDAIYRTVLAGRRLPAFRTRWDG